MRAATGRLIFFDKLAEGMQAYFYYGAPKRVALQSKSAIPRVPASDIKSLARALCRYHVPALEHVPETTWDVRNGSVASLAAVFDARGRTLSECIDRLKEQSFPDVLVVVNFVDDSSDFPRLDYNPRSQEDLIGEALEFVFSQINHLRPTVLTRVRFEERGFHALEDVPGLFDDPTILDWTNAATFEMFYYRLSRSWSYRGYPLLADKIRRWVVQFESSGLVNEAHQLLMYLLQFGYVTETTIVEALIKKFQEVEKGDHSEAVAISIQQPGKSEQKLAYRLKPHIELLSLADALPILRNGTQAKPTCLFCFDDCIGSGDSVINNLFNHNPYRNELIALFQTGQARISIIGFHVDNDAISRLENLPQAARRLRVLPVKIVDDSHRAFSESSRIFVDKARRAKFKEFCERVGEHLFPGSPLGWQNCQWVISYDYSIPDNSLPILFGTSSSNPVWEPLFERNR